MTKANEKSIVLLGYPLVCFLLAWPFLALRPHCFCSFLSSPSEIGHFLWQFPFLFGTLLELGFSCSSPIFNIIEFYYTRSILHFSKNFQLQVPERNVKGRRKSATSIETSDMFDPSSGRHENDIEVDNSTCKIRKLHQVQLFD